MKFKNWTLDDLINTLRLIKSSPDFKYENVIRVSGEIHVFNGERKDGQPEEEIWG